MDRLKEETMLHKIEMYYGHWAIEGKDACGHLVRVYYPTRLDGGPCQTKDVQTRMENAIRKYIVEGISCDVAYADLGAVA